MSQSTDDDEGAPAAIEHTDWATVRMQRALALWNECVAANRDLGYIRLVHVKVGIDKRRLDELALAGPLAMQQGKPDCHRRRHAGRRIAYGNRHLRRPAVRFANHAGNSGQRLRDIIISGLIAQWT